MANEPVLVSTVVTAIMALLAPLLLRYGFDAGGVQAIGGLIGAIIMAALTVYHAYLTRQKVTPSSPVEKAKAP